MFYKRTLTVLMLILTAGGVWAQSPDRYRARNLGYIDSL